MASLSGGSPGQGFGFASNAGTALKGRATKVADTPHHRLRFHLRRNFLHKRQDLWCYEVVIRRMQTGTYYLCNISRTAKLSGGRTSKSKSEGDFFNKAAEKNPEITPVLNFSILRLLHFYHKLLKRQLLTQVLAFLRSSDQLLTAIAQRCHCQFSLVGDAGKKNQSRA